jgi:uncharacterized coiled-coil DUF342 family protein
MESTSESNAEISAIKTRISEINSKPLDTHSQEFEEIHAELNKVLTEIDGL